MLEHEPAELRQNSKVLFNLIRPERSERGLSPSDLEWLRLGYELGIKNSHDLAQAFELFKIQPVQYSDGYRTFFAPLNAKLGFVDNLEIMHAWQSSLFDPDADDTATTSKLKELSLFLEINDATLSQINEGYTLSYAIPSSAELKTNTLNGIMPIYDEYPEYTDYDPAAPIELINRSFKYYVKIFGEKAGQGVFNEISEIANELDFQSIDPRTTAAIFRFFAISGYSEPTALSELAIYLEDVADDMDESQLYGDSIKAVLVEYYSNTGNFSIALEILDKMEYLNPRVRAVKSVWRQMLNTDIDINTELLISLNPLESYEIAYSMIVDIENEPEAFDRIAEHPLITASVYNGTLDSEIFYIINTIKKLSSATGLNTISNSYPNLIKAIVFRTKQLLLGEEKYHIGIKALLNLRTIGVLPLVEDEF